VWIDLVILAVAVDFSMLLGLLINVAISGSGALFLC
jgi:hypothetical protein